MRVLAPGEEMSLDMRLDVIAEIARLQVEACEICLI